jgi:hypothetical protein
MEAKGEEAVGSRDEEKVEAVESAVVPSALERDRQAG